MARIMVVDDEAEEVGMVKQALEAEGFEVVPAYSGRECIEQISEARPNMVLLDMKMPGMDGRETLKRIREKDKKVQVMFLSAIKVSPGEEMQLTAEYNIQGYIFKPITKAELAERIRDCI